MACQFIASFLNDYLAPIAGHPAGLLIGLIVGIGILLMVRGNQVWRARRSIGYNNYQADALRRRLGRWGGMTLIGAFCFASIILIQTYIYPLFYSSAASGGVSALTPTVSPHMELVIPVLGLTAPIVPSQILGGTWDVEKLDMNVGHLEGTSSPAEGGNTVLAGHVTLPEIKSPGPFFELESIVLGDRVYIESGSTTYTYEVVEIFHTNPTDVHVAFPTEDTRLTLITCTDWDGSKYNGRLVVVALILP